MKTLKIMRTKKEPEDPVYDLTPEMEREITDILMEIKAQMLLS
jgi:hypothetical protein